jgi:hypothetical protein
MYDLHVLASFFFCIVHYTIDVPDFSTFKSVITRVLRTSFHSSHFLLIYF